MNQYRNWHWATSYKFKEEFSALVKPQIEDAVPILGEYCIDIKLYYLRANCDGSNIIPLIEKVFLDVLVENRLIEGDSIKYHIGTKWVSLGQDKENPRCEITVYKKEEV